VNLSENELEEVLTVFTKISKSASIFLRSYTKPSSEHPLNNFGTVSGRQTTESCLPKRRDASAYSSSAAENTKNSSPQKPSIQENVGE